MSAAEEPRVVNSIVVLQDVGGPYSIHKRVALDLMSDGTVRWRKATVEDFPTPETRPAEFGGTTP